MKRAPILILVLYAWTTAAVALASPVNAGPQAGALPSMEAAEGELATLRGNTRPEANAVNDRGRVSDDMALDHMMLQLRRSSEREQALQQFIKDVHDPASPLFHHWITAAEFGQRYGASSAEAAAVRNWLESQGFTVNLVYPSQMLIDFTGSAGQIRQAFRTEIHNLEVNGEAHIANMSDPRIPLELVSRVAGIVSLNDFRPHPLLKLRANYRANYTEASGDQAIVPADLATIYNLNPAFAAGYSGQGQTIVLIEDTNLYTTADWKTFRSVMGLASKYPLGSLAQVHPPSSPANNCTNPGHNGDDVEATLDVEWASAAAPSAAIELAACSDTYTNFGGFIALQNLLNAPGTPPAIVSISYGESESYLGASFNAYISSLYQQAVTEGVSVFVSSGDEGAASSDANQVYAQSGITVSGFTSTPYNVSVGGTDFADTYERANATYWNSTNTASYGSARSYVPEIPWNDSCASVLIGDYWGMMPTDGSGGLCDHQDYMTTASGSGGPSGCASGAPDTAGVVSGTCAGYPKPSWQSGLIGNPNDGVRDIPDVSLFSANGVWGHYYVFCFSDPSFGMNCNGTPNRWAGAGGTSFASPIMAAIQSLVNQASGTRWGNPNSAYYSLAATEYGSGGNASCNSALGNTVATNCVFYDVNQIPLLYTAAGTGADIDVPCFGANCYLPSGRYGVLSTAPETLTSASVTSLGYGYGSAPSCTLSGGGGSGAACSASISGVVASAAVTKGGSGYTSYPTCTLTGGGGTGASCFAYICTNYTVCYVALSSFGSGYTSAPACKISGGGGTGATCTATEARGIAVRLTTAGSGYTTMPQCVLSGGGGTGGTCAAVGTNSSNSYQPAFGAALGWDFATGIGTVNAANLVASFAPAFVTLSSLSLSFSPQAVGTTSSVQSVTVTNPGTAGLTISKVTISGTNSGDFSKVTDSCTGVTVAPKGRCSVSVTFTPSAGDSRSASLNFTDNVPNSPQSASLSGTGTGFSASLSPTSLTFAARATGTTSSAQTATLTNTGTGTLTISSILLSGSNASAFGQASTCGASLSVGASCAISVTFTPIAGGPASASVTVTDNAAGGPQSVTLSGTGVAAPAVSLSPSSLSFATQTVGTSTASQIVTISNTGTAALVIKSVALTGANVGAFAQTNTCNTVPVGAHCAISVTFKPPSSGSKSASVTITDNAANSPQAIALSGTAVQSTVSLAPANLSFGSQVVGAASTPQTVTLTNTSAVTLNIKSIAIGGASAALFVGNSSCGATLGAGANCTVSVTFAPKGPGSKSASLTFTDDAANSPQSLAMTGTAMAPLVSLSPTSIVFANQNLGATGSARTVTLSNTGNSTLTIASIAITGANANAFGETTTCGSGLSAGASCRVSVTFTPTAAGTLTAALVVTDNAAVPSQELNLSGTGVAVPAVRVRTVTAGSAASPGWPER